MAFFIAYATVRIDLLRSELPSVLYYNDNEAPCTEVHAY